MRKVALFVAILGVFLVSGLNLAEVRGSEVGGRGIVPASCSYSRPQIQLDTSGSGGSQCFETTESGWIRTDVEKVYGVYNRSEYPVTIAFRLPVGSVFWQETIAPKSVRTLDVDRQRSRVIEMIVGSPDFADGVGSGELLEHSAVSFYQSAFLSTGVLGFPVFENRAKLVSNGTGNRFEDRLDATFVVFPGLADSNCYSFQSAGYPGLFLQAASGSNVVTRTANPDPGRSTWCVSEVKPGNVRLKVADGSGRWLENGGLGSVIVRGTATNCGIWRIDRGLADPK